VRKVIEVKKKVLEGNEVRAEQNRAIFDEKGILAVNLMSSPGSGKTTLIERTVDLLGERLSIGVIEGDLETDIDEKRIRGKGVPVHQITTMNTCHLDAQMIHDSLHHLPYDDLDLIFIENVGNLVCPASYDTGAHLNVVLLSVPEGDDKVAKYPVIFRKADLVLITKTDLLSHFAFDTERVKRDLKVINPDIDVMMASSLSTNGLEGWASYLVRVGERLFGNRYN
jgi:hydrogenase nickel incorporation protein HypB